MKKLLHAVSALSLMFMSMQAFASSNQNSVYTEEEKRQITTNLRNEGHTEQQIENHFTVANSVLSLLASYAQDTFASPVLSSAASLNFDEGAIQEVAHAFSQSGESNQEIDRLLADQMFGNQTVEPTLSSPEPIPVSDPASQATVVSTPPAPEPIPVSDPTSQATVILIPAPEPTIEEEVQKAVVKKVTVTMLSLKDRNSENHNNFMIVYRDLHHKMIESGSMKEKFALHIWIFKDEENRLYYPEKWVNFKKSPLAHRIRDANMVSETIQLLNLHALYYKAMDERYNVQIEDLRAIGSKDTRTEAEIIQSMSIPAELNETQKTIDDLSNIWRGVKRILK